MSLDHRAVFFGGEIYSNWCTGIKWHTNHFWLNWLVVHCKGPRMLYYTLQYWRYLDQLGSASGLQSLTLRCLGASSTAPNHTHVVSRIQAGWGAYRFLLLNYLLIFFCYIFLLFFPFLFFFCYFKKTWKFKECNLNSIEEL